MSNYFLYIALDTTALALSFLAIISSIMIHGIDNRFKHIMASYGFANMIANIFYIVNLSQEYTMSVKKHYHIRYLGTAWSILASLLHLMCLAVTEFIHVSNFFKTSSKSFRSILLVLWILAIFSCSLLDIAGLVVVKYASSISIIAFFFIFLMFYLTIIRKYIQKRLDIEHEKRKLVRKNAAKKNKKTFEMICFPRVILLGYFTCTLPMAISKLTKPMNIENDYVDIWEVLHHMNFQLFGLISLFLFAKYSDKRPPSTEEK